MRLIRLGELFLSSASTHGLLSLFEGVTFKRRPLVDVWPVKILPESMKAVMDLYVLNIQYVEQVKFG